jgi:UDP-N-acetylmuramoylalanine--D-glutamate ligase
MKKDSSQPFSPAMGAFARVEALRAALPKGGVSCAVVGAGKSGTAAAELLRSMNADVRVLDDKDGEPITAEALSTAELVVLSPGVPRYKPELAKAIERGIVVGEIELASWFVSAPLVGITGTNGKSTTTALTAHVFESAGLKTFAGGNLGRPLAELALSGEKVDVAVVELSSYQLESIVEASFAVACWLNLTPDHADRYANLETYALAKRRLLERRSVNGVAVLNAKDPVVSDAGIRLGGPARWFAADVSSDLASPMGTLLSGAETAVRTVLGAEERYDLKNAALLGLHNRANMLAAIECVRHFDVPVRDVERGLKSFRGLPHRIELVRTLDQVRYYNDSKATNVDSAVIALRALQGPKILIAGGKDKGAPWAPLVDVAREHHVAAVLAIGAATPLVMSAFAGAVPVLEDRGTLEAAILRARELAKPGTSVILSPACASFDQFKNYEHRGDCFRELVGALR